MPGGSGGLSFADYGPIVLIVPFHGVVAATFLRVCFEL
jgi:hypothetical protein